MAQQGKIDFKNKLKQFCHESIEQRIEVAKVAIKNAQEAANSEEKSSAGDKYETARAMGHLEKNMHARQLTENLKELAILHSINTNTICAAAITGAFIQCTGVSFFIAAGVGKQIVEGETILFLSPHAPLAKLLLGKRTGDNFLFNGINTVIVDVY